MTRCSKSDAIDILKMIAFSRVLWCFFSRGIHVKYMAEGSCLNMVCSTQYDSSPPPVSIQTQWWWYNSMGTRIIAFFLLIFHNFCNCREGRMMIIKRYYPQNCPIHHTTPFFITTHPLPALANVFEKIPPNSNNL